jgi:hypothetical protein
MHGHSSPHLGKAAVPEARHVEAGLARELAELGREHHGMGKLGGGGNGVAATLLALRARARRRRRGEKQMASWGRRVLLLRF